MPLPSPAAALAAVLPPDQRIAAGAIHRHLDGRIDVVLSDGERELDPALAGRLQPWARAFLALPWPARLSGLRFTASRRAPVVVGDCGGAAVANGELVAPLHAIVAQAHLRRGWADGRPLLVGLRFDAAR